MSLGLLFLTVLALAALAYAIGRRRAMATVGGDLRKLHSLPTFYGWITALWVFVPVFVIAILWLFGEGFVIHNSALTHIDPADVPAAREDEAGGVPGEERVGMLRSLHRDLRDLRDESRFKALGCDVRPQRPLDAIGLCVSLRARAS